MDSPLADIRIGEITHQWAENNQLFSCFNLETQSTNALAKEEAFTEKLREEYLCLYLTDHQTAGRGRGSHHWLDAKPGSSLLSSWSFLLKVKPQPTVSCLVGLAVYRACAATWPFLAWNLKAPNDIYIGEKKVAGLLLESLIQGDDIRLIVGLGLNITASPAEFPSATNVLSSLPLGAPLLGQDYLTFLDRLIFELSVAISHCDELLNTSDRLSLLTALNQHPLLKEKYTSITADGSLRAGANEFNWMTL